MKHWFSLLGLCFDGKNIITNETIRFVYTTHVRLFVLVSISAFVVVQPTTKGKYFRFTFRRYLEGN